MSPATSRSSSTAVRPRCVSHFCHVFNLSSFQSLSKEKTHFLHSTTSHHTKHKQISVVLNKQTLYLLHAQDFENQIELAFQQKYGNIVAYRWFGEGRIMIGFASGYFVVVSTDPQQIGQVGAVCVFCVYDLCVCVCVCVYAYVCVCVCVCV